MEKTTWIIRDQQNEYVASIAAEDKAAARNSIEHLLAILVGSNRPDIEIEEAVEANAIYVYRNAIEILTVTEARN